MRAILNSDKTTECSDKTTEYEANHGPARPGHHRIGAGGAADPLGSGDGDDPAIDGRPVSWRRGGQYATVQKLLDRMEAKEYVRRDRSLFVHRFVPVLDRDQLIGRRLRSLAETLCDGSLTPLLTHLARAGDLTEEDRQALRAIIEESDRDDLYQEIAPESLDARKQNALVTARQSRTGPGRLPRSEKAEQDHRRETVCPWNPL